MHDISTCPILTLSPNPTSNRRASRIGLRGGRSRHYTPAEKLAARTIRTASCWNVQGCAGDRTGHVHISSGSATKRTLTKVYAHRLAYELAYGPIPAGLVVMHRCDNPRCVNPEHLTLGSQADNVADAVHKGRHGAWHRTGRRLNGQRSKRQPLPVLERVPHVHVPIVGELVFVSIVRS